jgi:hypothetical protein
MSDPGKIKLAAYKLTELYNEWRFPMKAFRIVLLIAGVVLIVAIGFLAGRLSGGPGLAQALGSLGLANEPPQGGGGPAGEVIVIDQGGGPVRITFSDPEEIPGERPDTLGLFLRKQDNSLILGTGNIEVNVEVINDEVTTSAQSDGPEVEVVVTGETIIYEDITEPPVIGPEDVEKGELVVRRQVRQVENLDGLSENMAVRVWGERTGDRFIARLLVYDKVGLQ